MPQDSSVRGLNVARRHIVAIVALHLITTFATTIIIATGAHAQDDAQEIDSVSGLIIDDAKRWQVVRVHCTACHSAKLITQIGLDRDAWEETIRWMQEEQGLWLLGKDEPKILDYLSEHYGAQRGTRLKRKNLD